MKKILPIILFCLIFFSLISPYVVSAEIIIGSPTGVPVEIQGKWVSDPEVTFVGKAATRSNDFLNWTLLNYDWIQFKAGERHPLLNYWFLVAGTVFSVLLLFILGSAFVMVVTRGQNLTIWIFVKRFVFVTILIVMSFALVQFLYAIGDYIQGWLLRVDGPGGKLISSHDLLFIDFDYKFSGYRLAGAENDESAFISLLLVKLTAITYYVMSGILLIRKIILWFFLIVSPVFPLLLFFRPVRNTAKIWIGEFFRWLLYAPLFALFLHGLVRMWKERIPLPFDFSEVGIKTVYPTAINILLGGPGQAISITNSVNLRDTFAQYVVALLMLWVVILLPFLLLRIFLDYLNSVSVPQNAWIRQTFNKNMGFAGPKGPTPGPNIPPTPPGKIFSSGMARQLPFVRGLERTISGVKTDTIRATNTSHVQATNEILKNINISIPKMTDIAKYERSILSKDTTTHKEVASFHETLEKIANPSVVATPIERQKFQQVRERLVEQKDKGNQVASSILSASDVIVSSKQDKAMQAGASGGQVISHDVQGKPVIGQTAPALPVVNRVQQVSIEDYEEVRKMWVDNYESLEPPRDIAGKQVDREEWIKNDLDKINEAISLMSSVDPKKVNEGMEIVGNILPFLLMGGFSKSEVVTYLKAKLEAAKSVMGNISKKQEEEDTMLGKEQATQTAEKTMETSAQIKPEEEEAPPKNLENVPEFGKIDGSEEKPIS